MFSPYPLTTYHLLGAALYLSFIKGAVSRGGSRFLPESYSCDLRMRHPVKAERSMQVKGRLLPDNIIPSERQRVLESRTRIRMLLHTHTDIQISSEGSRSRWERMRVRQKRGSTCVLGGMHMSTCNVPVLHPAHVHSNTHTRSGGSVSHLPFMCILKCCYKTKEGEKQTERKLLHYFHTPRL